jgi:hypothetical protein
MHGLWLPLALVVVNVLVCVRIKAWRMFLAFMPAALLLMVVVATWRDRLVAWRVL